MSVLRVQTIISKHFDFFKIWFSKKIFRHERKKLDLLRYFSRSSFERWFMRPEEVSAENLSRRETFFRFWAKILWTSEKNFQYLPQIYIHFICPEEVSEENFPKVKKTAFLLTFSSDLSKTASELTKNFSMWSKLHPTCQDKCLEEIFF